MPGAPKVLWWHTCFPSKERGFDSRWALQTRQYKEKGRTAVRPLVVSLSAPHPDERAARGLRATRAMPAASAASPDAASIAPNGVPPPSGPSCRRRRAAAPPGPEVLSAPPPGVAEDRCDEREPFEDAAPRDIGREPDDRLEVARHVAEAIAELVAGPARTRTLVDRASESAPGLDIERAAQVRLLVTAVAHHLHRAPVRREVVGDPDAAAHGPIRRLRLRSGESEHAGGAHEQQCRDAAPQPSPRDRHTPLLSLASPRRAPLSAAARPAP